MSKLNIGTIYKRKQTTPPLRYFPDYIVIQGFDVYNGKRTALYNALNDMFDRPFEEYASDILQKYDKVENEWLK